MLSVGERSAQLSAQFNAFRTLLTEGGELTGEGGKRIRLVFEPVVHVETRWEPNPNYDLKTAEETGELPHIQQEFEEDLLDRHHALSVLWEYGIVTNEYAEARLNEITTSFAKKRCLTMRMLQKSREHNNLTRPPKLC